MSEEQKEDRVIESCDKFLEGIREESIVNPSETWLLDRISELYEWIDYYEYELSALRETRRQKKGYVPILPLKTGIN